MTWETYIVAAPDGALLAWHLSNVEPEPEWIKIGDDSIARAIRSDIRGWRYVDDAFVPAAKTTPSKSVDSRTFRLLFTPQERLAITQAAASDPMIRMFMDDAQAASILQLDHADVLQGIHYLQSLGLLTVDRTKSILAGENSA